MSSALKVAVAGAAVVLTIGDGFLLSMVPPFSTVGQNLAKGTATFLVIVIYLQIGQNARPNEGRAARGKLGLRTVASIVLVSTVVFWIGSEAGVCSFSDKDADLEFVRGFILTDLGKQNIGSLGTASNRTCGEWVQNTFGGNHRAAWTHSSIVTVSAGLFVLYIMLIGSWTTLLLRSADRVSQDPNRQIT